jgi:hypothetical protein
MIAMMPHPPLPRALSFLHSRLASTPPRPAHHHIDLPAAATGADQPFATRKSGASHCRRSRHRTASRRPPHRRGTPACASPSPPVRPAATGSVSSNTAASLIDTPRTALRIDHQFRHWDELPPLPGDVRRSSVWAP